MEPMFAPWRIEWVERDDDEVDGCPFCVLPERDDDREHRIVARGDGAFVLLNIAPYNPGHVMVVPHVHTGDFTDLDDETLRSHGRTKQRTLAAVDTAFDPDGANTGMNLGGDAAGGSIGDHVHEHVLPRWTGDTNFMPVASGTNVIVEALSESYDRLHDAFAAQDGTAVTDSGAVRLPV